MRMTSQKAESRDVSFFRVRNNYETTFNVLKIKLTNTKF